MRRWFNTPRTQRALLILLLILPLVRVAATYRVFSQVLDEPFHVGAGLEWLATNHYELDREHPPLARAGFALSTYLSGTRLTPGADAVAQGNAIFYRNKRYQHNLTLARVPNLAFLLIALLVTGVWTRRLFGGPTALLAIAMLGCVPSLLGHAGLATTDMAVAAMTILALFLLCRWLEQPTWRNTILVAVAAGIGLLTKFSFLVFFPAGAIVFVSAFGIFHGGALTIHWRRRTAQCLIATTIAAIAVWAGYKFSTGRLSDMRATTFEPGSSPRIAAKYAEEPGYSWVRPDILERYWHYGNDAAAHGVQNVDFVDWARAVGYSSPRAGRHGDTLRGAPPIPPPTVTATLLEPLRAAYQYLAVHAPLPAPEFLVGLEYVAHHSRTGHPAFLLGRYSGDGWWYYFLVVLFFKTPLPLVLLILAGVPCLAFEAWHHRNPEVLGVALAPAALLLPAMTSSINIGIRHVLPIYPFLTIAAAFAVATAWRTTLHQPSWRAALLCVLVWYGVSTVLAHPDYLSYFNESAGKHPERIATDSNLDWGQDLLRFASYARKADLHPLYIAYFGTAEWPRHIPQAKELPRDRKVTGWIAISQMQLQFGGAKNRGEDFFWLHQQRPERRIGSSIWLYHVAGR